MLLLALSFTRLWANSADNKLMIFLFLFILSREEEMTARANCVLRNSDISCKLSPLARNVKTCSVEKKKIKMSSAEYFTQHDKR